MMRISECNVFYAAPDGDPDSQGLIPSAPTTIQHAIDLASCTNAIIRMEIGVYNIDKSLSLASNMTLEGGFFDEFKQKTSEPGATTIYRTNMYPEGTSRAPRLVAIEANSLNDFRLQDLTVQTADAEQLPPLQTSSSNYDDKECVNGTEPGEVTVSLVFGQTPARDNFPGPLPGRWLDYRYATLYTAEEMGNSAFTITAIGFDAVNPTAIPSGGHPRRMKMWMKHTSRVNLAQGNAQRKWGFLKNAQPTPSEEAAVLVFDGVICVEAGRVTIPVNFDYNGTSSLMVLIESEGCKNDGTQAGYCTAPVLCGPSATSSAMSIGVAGPARYGGNPAWPLGDGYTLATILNPQNNPTRPNTYFYSCTDRTVDGAVSATVGNGATSETFPLPGAHGHHRMAALYSSTEIGTGPKMFTGLAFDVSSVTPSVDGGRTRSVRVYLKNTNASSLVAGDVWNSYLSGASLVYSGTLCLDGGGWATIPVPNFAYEGENLMVLVEGEGCQIEGGCPVYVNCHPATASCAFFTTDEPIYYSINTLQLSPKRPNIQFYSQNDVNDDGSYYVSQSNYGVSTYALHISSCHSYDLVRCQFISGSASAGRDGVKGKDGGDGGDGGPGGDGQYGYCSSVNDSVVYQNWDAVRYGGAGGASGVAGYSAGTTSPASQGGQGGSGGLYNSITGQLNCNSGGGGMQGGGASGGDGTLNSDNRAHMSSSNAGAVLAKASHLAASEIGTAEDGGNGSNGANASPNGNLIDCSYSAASTEWCYIPNAQPGQWYIFLICNYSRAAGDISFSVINDNAATTNCNILANVSNNGPLCEGEALQLTCSVYSSSYSWTGPNGFTSNQQNPIIYDVTTANAGTYTVTYVVNGESRTTSTTVEIFPRPSADIVATPDNATICNGGNVRLDVVDAANCEGCQFHWSTGAATPSINVMPSVTTTYGVTVSNGNCMASIRPAMVGAMLLTASACTMAVYSYSCSTSSA